MRQLKLLGVTTMAIFALGIAATSAAQAVELKFLPGTATWSLKSNGQVTIVRLAGGQIVCTSAKGVSEVTSEAAGITEVMLSGCLDPTLSAPCTGLSDTTGNITFKGAFHLRHLLSPLEIDTTLVLLFSPTHYSCSSLLFILSGCLSSDDLKKDNGTLLLRGELVSLFQVVFLQVNGDAVVQSIDTSNSLGMEGCILLSTPGAGMPESEALEGSFTAEKCEVGGKPCSFLIDLTGTL
jgi:hypothetical protein